MLILIPVFALVNLVLDFYFPNFGMLLLENENLWRLDFQLINPIVSKVLSFLFLSVNAILVNFVFNSVEFHKRITNIPSVMYFLTMSLLPMSLHFSETLIAHFLFLFAFYHLMSVKQNDDARNNAFLSGLFLGLAASFMPLYAPFLLIIWIGVFIIRPFLWREFILPMVGLVIPFLWISLLNPVFYKSLFTFESTIDYLQVERYFIITIMVTMCLLILYALRNILKQRSQSSIRFKRIVSITIYGFALMALLGALIFTVTDSAFYFGAALVILPFILSYAFLNLRRIWFSYVLFYCLLVINVVKFFMV